MRPTQPRKSATPVYTPPPCSSSGASSRLKEPRIGPDREAERKPDEVRDRTRRDEAKRGYKRDRAQRPIQPRPEPPLGGAGQEDDSDRSRDERLEHGDELAPP